MSALARNVAPNARFHVHSGDFAFKRGESRETVLDNLTLLAVVIIVFWLGALAYFFYTSRQQKEIQEELDVLRDMLEDETREPNS